NPDALKTLQKAILKIKGIGKKSEKDAAAEQLTQKAIETQADTPAKKEKEAAPAPTRKGKSARV
ncbi:MAG: hypothetical protein KDD22_06345, partial [Bdellovibrionales bacterium]|nr:hypothetical protein [Bdellovibrionales bacterium]